MRPIRVVCVLLVLATSADTLWAQARDKKPKPGDNVPGKRWEYEVRKGGKVIEEGTFRAHLFKIYKGALEQGTYKPDGPDKYHLNITKGQLKGEVDLTLIRKGPKPIFGGQYKAASGDMFRIRVKFLDD